MESDCEISKWFYYIRFDNLILIVLLISLKRFIISSFRNFSIIGLFIFICMKHEGYGLHEGYNLIYF